MVDCLVIVLWAAVLAGLILGLSGGPGSLGGAPDQGEGHLTGFLTLTVPAILYFALCESAPWRATPGKRLLGLRVHAADGGRLSLGRALLRAAVRLLPWELAHFALWRIPGWPAGVSQIPVDSLVALAAVWFLVGLYAWTLVAAPDGRAPWDHLAGSRVARSPTATPLP
jgi:uncharacterized RDD family membrane protein YckC